MLNLSKLRMQQLLCALILVLIGAHGAAAEDDNPELAAFTSRIDRLVDAPGSSNSAAAGLVNPAAWPIQGHGAFYLGWEEPAAELSDSVEVEDLSGVLSFGNLGFGAQRLVYDVAGEGAFHLYDYTLGIGAGNRSIAFGVSYAWRRGWRGAPGAGFGSSERWAAGILKRWRAASLGFSYSYERETRDGFYQADLGIRPFGPRWTLFGDVVIRDGDELINAATGQVYDDDVIGFGAKLDLLPGLTLAARGRDSGEFSLRLDFALPGERKSGRQLVTRLSGRAHFDDDQEHASTTLALESTVGTHLGQLFALEERYPELHLKGGLVYRNYRWFDDRRNFLATLQQISDYGHDASVAGLAVNLSSIQASPAKLWELRAQLAGFRARGKKVLVYVDRANLFSYMLATVADEIWLDPLGDIDIKGLTLGRTYIRRMLDKVGIGIDEWRYFTYKSAMETLSRTSMSDADREQFQAFADDWYGEAVRLARAARGISEADWNELRDGMGELMAAEALAAGLVDSLGDFHEATDHMKKLGRRETDDLVVAPLDGLMGDPIWGPEEWGEPPTIALLYAIGDCSMDKGIKGRQLSKVIRKVRENPQVEAVVMRADSPGGDALPSDLVSRELKLTQARKPVYISQGQVAGSGGYWISMHSDGIFVSPYTLTGSIGVISGHIWDKELGEKIGLDYDQVKIGEHSDVFRGPRLPFIGVSIPHRPVTEEERQRGEKIMKDLYWDFIDQVSEGRDMTAEEIDQVGQGRVWSGTDGLEIGLVDEMGGLWHTLLKAKEAAGIPADRPVQIIQGPSIGAFDGSFLKPDFLRFRIPWLGSKTEAPTRLLDGEPWDRLPEQERLYLEKIIEADGKPLLMMRPVSVEGVTLDP